MMKDSMVLSWQPPTNTGSSDISAYIIEKRDAKRNTWAPVDKVTGLTLSYAVQKLLEGNQYYFRVSAENDIGTSEPVELKEPVLAKCPYGMLYHPNFDWHIRARVKHTKYIVPLLAKITFIRNNMGQIG